MNILVLNGSPKAKASITLQNLLYLEKKFPQHSFSYIHVGCPERSNRENIEKTKEAILSSDLVIFSFPVYTFIAPGQLHAFIRILKESNFDAYGKKATCITTSKHFYDMTAHKYLEENLLDMNFEYIEGLSLDMEDLLKKEGEGSLVSFFRRTLWAVENNIAEKRTEREKKPLPEIERILTPTTKTDDYTLSIVADYTYNKERVERLIENFTSFFPYKTKVVDLSAFSFKGGCLGCLKCAIAGKCVYNDGFNDLLEKSILSSDGVIYAFSIVDHSMGPGFKTYDDRRFYNGHRTVSQFKPVGYLVDGDIETEENLKTILLARSDVGRNYLTGIASDNHQIEKMALSMSYALENKYARPRTFYGVGGMKIFRDLIWVMRGIMKDDHKFYKENGFYDFPQRERGKMMALCLAGSLMRNKKFMKKNACMINDGMLAPYKKVIEKAGSSS